jgi:hypothetical protein
MVPHVAQLLSHPICLFIVVYAESFIDYNYEEINNICNPYWVAAYPDVVSNSNEDEEATPPGGLAPAGRPRRASDLDEDPDVDLPIGRLRAGGGAAAGGAAA